MMTPPWKMKPSVVVPWLGFTYSTTSRSNESICKTSGRGGGEAPGSPSSRWLRGKLLLPAQPHICHCWEREALRLGAWSGSYCLEAALLPRRAQAWLQQGQIKPHGAAGADRTLLRRQMIRTF